MDSLVQKYIKKNVPSFQLNMKFISLISYNQMMPINNKKQISDSHSFLSTWLTFKVESNGFVGIL